MFDKMLDSYSMGSNPYKTAFDDLIKLCDKVEKRKKDMDNLANSKRRDIDATLHLIKNTPSTPQENAPYIPPEVKQRLRAKLQKARDKVDLWDRAGRIYFGSYDDYRQAMDKDTAKYLIAYIEQRRKSCTNAG